MSVVGHSCSDRFSPLQSPAKSSDEKPRFGVAGHLISLLLQVSGVSPVLWQRDTESHLTSLQGQTQREKEKRKGSEGKTKEKIQKIHTR